MKHTYNEAADEHLHQLYKSVGAVTAENKVAVLNLLLGGESNFYPNYISTDQKQACLEIDYLHTRNLIQLDYC